MKEVRRYLEERLGKYSFYFEDMKSGFVYGYNEHVKMTSAGCMKLPVAMTVLKEAEEGKLSLETNILWKEGSGGRFRHSEGTESPGVHDQGTPHRHAGGKRQYGDPEAGEPGGL